MTGLQMTPGWCQAWKSHVRFPHLQPSYYYYGGFAFLPGLLANNEMAQRSNPALWKPVEQKSLHKTAYLMRNRAQRIPSWPGGTSPTKAEYICADQPAKFTFRSRNGGGPYIYSAPVAWFYGSSSHLMNHSQHFAARTGGYRR